MDGREWRWERQGGPHTRDKKRSKKKEKRREVLQFERSNSQVSKSEVGTCFSALLAARRAVCLCVDSTLALFEFICLVLLSPHSVVSQCVSPRWRRNTYNTVIKRNRSTRKASVCRAVATTGPPLRWWLSFTTLSFDTNPPPHDQLVVFFSFPFSYSFFHYYSFYDNFLSALCHRCRVQWIYFFTSTSVCPCSTYSKKLSSISLVKWKWCVL